MMFPEIPQTKEKAKSCPREALAVSELSPDLCVSKN